MKSGGAPRGGRARRLSPSLQPHLSTGATDPDAGDPLLISRTRAESLDTTALSPPLQQPSNNARQHTPTQQQSEVAVHSRLPTRLTTEGVPPPSNGRPHTPPRTPGGSEWERREVYYNTSNGDSFVHSASKVQDLPPQDTAALSPGRREPMSFLRSSAIKALEQQREQDGSENSDDVDEFDAAPGSSTSAASSVQLGRSALQRSITIDSVDQEDERDDKRVFDFDACTIHVRGVPDDVECDEEWLRSVMGQYGEYVQATIQRRENQLNYALVTFRKAIHVDRLLKTCRKTAGLAVPNDIRIPEFKARSSLRRMIKVHKKVQVAVTDPLARRKSVFGDVAAAIARNDSIADTQHATQQCAGWPVRLRMFVTKHRQEAMEWIEGGEGAEIRLALSEFQQNYKTHVAIDTAAQNATSKNLHGNMALCVQKSMDKVRKEMSGLRIYCLVERGYHLPIMDRVSSDPYVKVWHQDRSPPFAEHQDPSPSAEHFELVQTKPGLFRKTELGDVKKLQIFEGQNFLGQTKTVYENHINPAWGWVSSPKGHVISGIGKRGWLVLQALDEDKFAADDVCGQVYINLDQLDPNSITEGWYSIGKDAVGKSTGLIKVRVLLSSIPVHREMYDLNKEWLLSDFDFVRISDNIRSIKYQAEQEFFLDKVHNMQADEARLTWHLQVILDTAFEFFDVDTDQGLKASEIFAVLGVLGERLTANEVGQMIGEAKRWGQPDGSNASDILTDYHLVDADNANVTRVFQSAKHILGSAASALRNRVLAASSADERRNANDLPVIDLETDTINRNEFGIMMTEYWSIRKFSASVENTSDARKKLFLLELPMVELILSETGQAADADKASERFENLRLQLSGASLNTMIEVARRNGVPSDAIQTVVEELMPSDQFFVANGDALRNAKYLETKNGCFRKNYVKTVPDLPPIPMWISDITANHKRIEDFKRVPAMFWFFIRNAMEQLLTRAHNRGFLDQSNSIKRKLVNSQWRHKITEKRKKKQRNCIRNIDPPSTASMYWDLMQVVLLGYVLITVPYFVAFEKESEVGSLLWYWELWIDLFFASDIILSFRTPYIYKGEVIYDSRRMAYNYMATWFLPDVMSCASFVQYFLSTSQDDSVDGTRTTKLVRLTRLAKLLRLARLKRALNRIGERAFERVGTTMMTALAPLGSLFSLLIGFALAVHLLACTWYLIGSSGDGWVATIFGNFSGTVIGQVHADDDDDGLMRYGTDAATFERYMTSMFSIMLSEFHAQPTAGEQVFAIMSVLVNSFIFGSVAATLSSIMIQLRAPHAAYDAKMDVLKTWMRSKELNHGVRDVIERYYDAKLSGAAKKLINEAAILSELQPAPIAAEVVVLLYTRTIEHVPIFSGLPEEIIIKLCLLLHQLPALAGAPVVVQGRVGGEMYIVNKGRLQVWEETKNAHSRARCSLNGHQFWATVYDQHLNFAEKAELIDELNDLVLSDLLKQCEVDSVPAESITAAMDSQQPTQSLVSAIVTHVAGGTIDVLGQENRKQLEHRAIVPSEVHFKGICRHASQSINIDAPIRRTRYFMDFDPCEGESDIKIHQSQEVDLIEIRRGNVLGYLGSGDYTGEGCFLDFGLGLHTGGHYRHTANVTAVQDSDLCYLRKEDVMKLKDEFPELETSMRSAFNERLNAEGARRLFMSTAGGDGTLSPVEMARLLKKIPSVEIDDLDQHIRTMDKDGKTGVNLEQFESWFRYFNAGETSRCRDGLENMSLGEVMNWAETVNMDESQLVDALNSADPKQQLISKILVVPQLLALWLQQNTQSRRETQLDAQSNIDESDGKGDAVQDTSITLWEASTRVKLEHMSFGYMYSFAKGVGLRPDEMQDALSHVEPKEALTLKVIQHMQHEHTAAKLKKQKQKQKLQVATEAEERNAMGLPETPLVGEVVEMRDELTLLREEVTEMKNLLSRTLESIAGSQQELVAQMLRMSTDVGTPTSESPAVDDTNAGASVSDGSSSGGEDGVATLATGGGVDSDGSDDFDDTSAG